MSGQGRGAKMGLLFLVLLLLFLEYGAALALLLPQNPETDLLSKGKTTLDVSQADQGYFLAKHSGGDKRLKLRVSKEGDTFDYDLNPEGRYEVFPLQMGDGKYRIQLYEQTQGDKYTDVFDQSLEVTLADPALPYLYPNQYVNYDGDTEAVKLAAELTAGADGDMDKFKAVSGYIKQHILYDYMRALQVQGGSLTTYLPDVDQTLASGMGICFDYAALMACMLRSQGVPTKVVIGFADGNYHAWNNILIDGKWARYDPTNEVTGVKIKEYTEERWY